MSNIDTMRSATAHLYAVPPYVDYDAVERITQLLIHCALRKRTTMFAQVKAACQGLDIDQVVRGHLTANNEQGPDNETLFDALNHCTGLFKAMGWPPLTVLVTKDGKTVASGFWANSPQGDLSSLSDTSKRNVELAWRADCLAYFDPLSSLNESLSQYIQRVHRAVKASAEQFPALPEAFEAIAHPMVNGVRTQASYSTLDALVRKGLTLDDGQSRVLAYDPDLFIDPNAPKVISRVIMLPVGAEKLNVMTRLLNEDQLREGAVCTLKSFELMALVNAKNEAANFTLDPKVSLITGSKWLFEGKVSVSGYGPDTTVRFAGSMDRETGAYQMTCSDSRIQHIFAKVEATLA